MGEKDKFARKFKRLKKDVKAGETKSPSEQIKKKRNGDDLMEVDPAGSYGAKKAKCDGSDVVLTKNNSDEAGLSEQPCESK